MHGLANRVARLERERERIAQFIAEETARRYADALAIVQRSGRSHVTDDEKAAVVAVGMRLLVAHFGADAVLTAAALDTYFTNAEPDDRALAVAACRYLQDALTAITPTADAEEESQQ